MDSFNATNVINAAQTASRANTEASMSEAERNRQFQLYASNTAHQREVEDLKAAGLNPILSANSGASTPSGSMGQVDTSFDGVLAQVYGHLLNQQTQLEATRLNAENSKAIAEKQMALNQFLGLLQNQTNVDLANLSALTSRYVSDNSLKGAYAGASASRYVADVQQAMQNQKLKWTEEHPDSLIEAINSLTGKIFPNESNSGVEGFGNLIKGFSFDGNLLNVPDWLRDMMSSIFPANEYAFYANDPSFTRRVGGGYSGHSGKF